MDEKAREILQQIAIDVAVIKTKIEEIEDLSKKAADQEVQLAELKTQMKVGKWFGGLLSAGLVGVLIKTFYPHS